MRFLYKKGTPTSRRKSSFPELIGSRDHRKAYFRASELTVVHAQSLRPQALPILPSSFVVTNGCPESTRLIYSLSKLSCCTLTGKKQRAMRMRTPSLRKKLCSSRCTLSPKDCISPVHAHRGAVGTAWPHFFVFYSSARSWRPQHRTLTSMPVSSYLRIVLSIRELCVAFISLLNWLTPSSRPKRNIVVELGLLPLVA